MSAARPFVIKVELEDQVRRFSLPDDRVAWAEARGVLALILGTRTAAASIVFIDGDGDEVTVTNSAEFDDAVLVAREEGWSALRLLIRPSDGPAFSRLARTRDETVDAGDGEGVGGEAKGEASDEAKGEAKDEAKGEASSGEASSGEASSGEASSGEVGEGGSLDDEVKGAEGEGSEMRETAGTGQWVVVPPRSRLSDARVPPPPHSSYVPQLLRSIFTPSSAQRAQEYAPAAIRAQLGGAPPSYDEAMAAEHRGDPMLDSYVPVAAGALPPVAAALTAHDEAGRAVAEEGIRRTASFQRNPESEAYVPTAVDVTPTIAAHDEAGRAVAEEGIRRTTSFQRNRESEAYVPMSLR